MEKTKENSLRNLFKSKKFTDERYKEAKQALIEKYNELKAQGKIYLDMEYDYDKSTLRKTEYWR